MSRQTDHTRITANSAAGNPAFDQAARRHHAQALGAISPQTLARLRASRLSATSAAATRRAPGWLLGVGSAAVLALAIAVQLPRDPVETAAPLQAAATPADGELGPALANDDYRSLVAGLDENPDLYLWLAANDEALPGAMTP